MYKTICEISSLTIAREARNWCKLPYPGHLEGCPNYGRKETCPPVAPFVVDYFDLTKPVWFAIVRFDLAEHMARMKGEHPAWSDRQLRNLLYWQGGVNRELRLHTEQLLVLSVYDLVATYVPEAMGVDVLTTLKRLNVPIEIMPVHYVHKVAMIGQPRWQDLDIK